MIATANPVDVEHILKTNFENYPKGKPFTDLLGDFLRIGIFNVHGELWSTQRKLASHKFSTKSLREFVVNVLQEEVENGLIPLPEASTQNGIVLDMQDVLRRNLKLPSKRPSIVCENCLYSLEKDLRARAFHILDPKGIVEMLLVFLEEKGAGVLAPPSLNGFKDNTSRITPHLGKWKGYSITKRSGVYGATIAEADTMTSFEIDENGQLIQDQTSTFKDRDASANVLWTGTMCDNLVKYDGGFQVTLLPGGMYMGCPSDVGKNVAEGKSFHLEFCWLESPTKRQRLVRTYDVEGLAVSSTYFIETKL